MGEVKRSTELVAQSKDGLTWGELLAWVHSAELMADNSQVRVTTGFRGQVRTIRVST